VERDWWARTILVLQRPSSVFAALRSDDDEERQEPLLAIILLAGIAGVLSSNAASRILDDFEIDGLVLAVWAFVAGGLYGAVGYFVLGALTYLGSRVAGSAMGYRRARHVLGFAAVPLALSLIVWPVRLAIYGADVFKSEGDDAGTGGSVFEAIELGVMLWAVALLVVGLRAYNAWSWPRATAAASPILAVLALALARAFGLL
jgi:hypothetical protein